MILDLSQLEQLSMEVVKHLPDGGIVLLKGDLASGKTTFVNAFVKFLGMDEDVSSPTFSIMNIYNDRVYHYDIYNEGSSKFIESGLLENLEHEGYHFIEWADEKLEKILDMYGFEFITIEIEPKDKKREYNIV